ncbi:MAG: hypothetical protein FWD97_05140 [Defluviitaleaceae bacterium]|nr:hypothetical protein [Defluviitaleaceae bacterium]
MVNPITQNLIQPYQPRKKPDPAVNTTSAETATQLSIGDESDDRQALLREKLQEFREQQEISREKMRRMREDAANAREAAKAQVEYWRNQRLAMKIATRIKRGDNVPQRDKDFLLEQSPGMFKLAMSARQRNEDPKDYDSIAPEREQDNPAYGVDMNPASVRELPGSSSAQTSSNTQSTTSMGY